MEEENNPPVSPLIVGIGASAGGLEAVSLFLGKLPRDCGFAVLVMFHLEPGGNHLLADVLARATPLPVVDAQDGMRLEPGQVYALPGHSLVSVTADGVLRLQPTEKPEGRRSAIDHFFQSLAQSHGEGAVAIIMSGAGSDGSLGLQAVSKAGGLTMVQHPETAKHDSMPQSASETGVADHVLPPERLAEELLAHARHFHAEALGGLTKALVRDVAEAFPEICEILLQATGHNFKHYKTSTIVRRTMRRLQVLRIPTVEQYLERLRKERSEAERLFTELLINVTAFFRDPDAFASLEELVLPKLFEESRAEEPVRLWVPGCATGEEAYSLAILLSEQLDKLKAPREVQVFATDIDDQALGIARQGIYSQDVAEQISPERLQRFFVKKGQRYQICKSVRELVLFSSHNLINDPPFCRMDLISCRNLLIYLGSHLQKKLIPLFHYALRPGGHLFLGPSETLTGHRELFRPLDARNRISQRLPTAIRTGPLVEGKFSSSLSKNAPSAAPTEVDAYLVMQRIILDEFAPKGLLVNEDGQIISTSGNLEKYLGVPSGAFHNSVTRLVRDGLRVALRAALAEAARVRRKIVHSGLTLRTSEGVQRITLVVQPMPQLGEDSDLYLVVFQDDGPPVTTNLPAPGPPNEVAAHLIEQLERDLASTRADLEKTVQELEAANEELKSSNEELLSMNEELQSANEEMETSKEDLQSANDALVESNSDLENLLASTRIATLFLSEDGHVRRATPAVDNIYNILPSDIGRPLAHFTNRAAQMPALPAARLLYTAERPIEDEVLMQDGSWYMRRVLPYRRPDGNPDGMVVTFVDVTERKLYEERLRYQLDVTRSLTENATTAIFMTDAESRCTFANAAALQMTGYGKDELVGHVLHEKIHHTRPDGSVFPIEDCPLDRALPDGAQARNHQDLFVRKDGVFFPVVCNATVIRQADKLMGTVIEVRDVTEERRWAEALRESESRLRQTANEAEAGRAQLAAVINGMNQGVVLFNQDRDVTRMNKAALALHGFADDEEMLNALDDFGELFETSDSNGNPIAVAQWPASRTLRGEEVSHFEMHVRRRDNGHHFVGLYSGSVVRAESGAIEFAVLSISDVTERVLAEDAMKASEARFRQLAEMIPQLAFTARPDGAVFWYNSRWYDYTGTSPQDLDEQGWQAVHDPRVLPDVMRRWKASTETGDVFDMVIPLRGADGSFKPFLTRINPLKDDNGCVVMWFGTSTDVSEERAAAEALRLREQELRTLADNTPDILTRFDRQMRHVFVNAAAERLTGKARLALLGKTNRELGMPAELCDCWESALRALFETGEPQIIEFSFDTEQGERHFSGRFVPEFGSMGEVEYALGVIHDRTAEKLAKESLHEEGRRKDEFLATLAHELRNPLAPIRTGLQVLKLSSPSGGSADKVRAMMERQLSHMVRLVDDLLDVSRISRGKVELKRERVNLTTVLENAVEACRPMIEASHHELLVRVPPGPLWVDIDPTRIAQAVGNLLNNAAKYTPNGGKLELCAEQDSGSVVVWVKDNGVGIPQDMQPELFKMFTQVGRTLDRSQGGLGIGLSLVKRLVEMHGGSVSVQSAGAALGSTFTIRLPLPHLMPPAAHIVDASVNKTPAPVLVGKRVLVVDDNVDAAESLAMVLEMTGHQIKTAHSGAQALALAEHFVPDVVFLDIGLPGMDGHAVARQIRQDPSLQKATLVALTGWGSEEDKRRSREAGFDHHLTKPVEANTVQQLLESLNQPK